MDDTDDEENSWKNAQFVSAMVYRLTKFFNNVRTAYRRINHPEIRRGHLVVDIGSGGMPNPRANVACDFSSDDLERSDELKIDRPFVWANVSHLPFANHTFDYSIASHVLEHLENPANSLEEIQRVSRAGYIETPNAFYEFAIPHRYHLSRCTVIDGKLIVTMKKSWDETLDASYPDVAHDMNASWWALHNLDACALLTMYRWRKKIEYVIQGGEAFRKPLEELEEIETERSTVRKILIWLVYWIFRPRKKIDLSAILVCPACKVSLAFDRSMEHCSCASCGRTFGKYRGHFDFRI